MGGGVLENFANSHLCSQCCVTSAGVDVASDHPADMLRRGEQFPGGGGCLMRALLGSGVDSSNIHRETETNNFHSHRGLGGGRAGDTSNQLLNEVGVAH